MDRSKSLIMVLILSLVLVFSSCSLLGGEKQSGLPNGGSTTSSNSGSGVTLEFAEGNPGSEMAKGREQTFAFVFKNYQEHEVDDLRLRTKGFDRGYVNGLQENYNVQTIPKFTSQAGAGVYAGLIEEGVKVDDFAGQKFNLDPRFEYCYTAKTNFVESLCIPDTSNQCEVNVESNIQQNGPLKITIDRINSVENDIIIYFNIVNKEDGKVVNECFKTDDYATEYTLEEVKLGTSTGSCEAVSGYQIANDKASFRCTFSRDGDGSYSSNIIVNLEYLYNQEIQKKIEVVDLDYGYDN